MINWRLVAAVAALGECTSSAWPLRVCGAATIVVALIEAMRESLKAAR